MSMSNHLLPTQAEELLQLAKRNKLTNQRMYDEYLGFYAKQGDAETVCKGISNMLQEGYKYTDK